MSEIQVEQVVDRYGRVPENLLLADGVTSDECRLYALLTTYDYRYEHECWPTQQTLADRLGWSLRTTTRVLAALRERGAVEVERHGRAPARIRLVADLIPNTSDLTHQESLIGQTESSNRSDRVSAPLINEKERNSPRTRARNPRDDLFDVFVAEFGTPTKSGAALYAKVAGEIIEMPDASPEELRRRIVIARETWGRKTFGPKAIAQNWPMLGAQHDGAALTPGEILLRREYERQGGG